MNKSDLRSLIREEIKKVIAEAKGSALDKVKTREDVIDLIVKEFPDQKNKTAGMKSNTKFWTMNRLMNHYRELSNKPKSKLKEAKASKATTDSATIKSNFDKDVTGFYIVIGGQFGSNPESWNEAKVKKWIFYTPDYDEANQDKYAKDGYTRVEIQRSGEIDIATF